MALENILKELAALSPEERKALGELFGGKPVEEKKKNPPATPKAEPVYFFEQIGRYETTSIEVEKQEQGEILKKQAVELPPRVIAVDAKSASKLFWKRNGKFRFLGRSNGAHWRKARSEGKSVAESQALEYAEMLKAPDMTPPFNREKTFFAGKSLNAVSRGQEISWAEGVQQTKI